MELPTAVEALSALAQEHRLAVFRLLVRAGPEGVAAGEVARALGVLPNTLSTHLTILAHAGLVQSRRAGRSVIYSADYDGMRDLLGFLVADCCAGRPEICRPLKASQTTRSPATPSPQTASDDRGGSVEGGPGYPDVRTVGIAYAIATAEQPIPLAS